MSDPASDWQPGMRARCFLPDAAGELRFGRLYLVNRVHPSIHGTHLTLAPDVIGLGWHAARFERVVPACDSSPRRQDRLYPHPDFWKKLDGTQDGF